MRGLRAHPRAAAGWHGCSRLGLAAAVLPELLPMKGLPQGRPQTPTGDLGDHVMVVLERLGDAVSFPLALAALLHDIGKPVTVGAGPTSTHFTITRRWPRDGRQGLRAPRAFQPGTRPRHVAGRETPVFVRGPCQMRLSRLKTILAHPGIRDLLSLHRADAEASGRSIDHVEYCESLLREWSTNDLNPPYLLTGDDLKEAGLRPGPLYKTLIDAVREAQLEGTVKCKEEAIELLKRLLEERERGENQ